MNQTAEGSGASFMEKVSAFIVDKRSLIFLITIILLIFSAFSAQLGRGRERPHLLPAGGFRNKAGAERHGRTVHHLRHGEDHGRETSRWTKPTR